MNMKTNTNFGMLTTVLLAITVSSTSSAIETITQVANITVDKRCPDIGNYKFYWDESEGECQKCFECNAGSGLNKNCGNGDGKDAYCVECGAETYSSTFGYDMCQPCTYCGDGVANVIQECTSKTDRICGPCKPGYIKDMYGNCEPCINFSPGMYPECNVHTTRITPKVTLASPTNGPMSPSSTPHVVEKYTTKPPLVTHPSKDGEIASTTSKHHQGQIEADNSGEENLEESQRSTSNSYWTWITIGVFILVLAVVVSVYIYVVVVNLQGVQATPLFTVENIPLRSMSSAGETNDIESSDKSAEDSHIDSAENLRPENEHLLLDEDGSDALATEVIGNATQQCADRDNLLSVQNKNIYRVENEGKERQAKSAKSKKSTSSINSCIANKGFRRSRSKSGDSDSTEGQQLLTSDALIEYEDDVFEDSQDPVGLHSRVDEKLARSQIANVYSNDTMKESLPNLAVSSKEATVLTSMDDGASGGNTKNKDGRADEFKQQGHGHFQEGTRWNEYSQSQQRRLDAAKELARDKHLPDLFNDEAAFDDVVSYLTPPPDGSADRGHTKHYRSLMPYLGISHIHWNRIDGPRELLQYMHSSVTVGKRDVARLLTIVQEIDRVDIVCYLIDWVFKKYEK